MPPLLLLGSLKFGLGYSSSYTTSDPMLIPLPRPLSHKWERGEYITNDEAIYQPAPASGGGENYDVVFKNCAFMLNFIPLITIDKASDTMQKVQQNASQQPWVVVKFG